MIEPPVIEKCKNACHKLVLLDYDGTLVEYNPIPQHSIPTERLLKALKRLMKTSRTDVVVVTGRTHQDIDKLLGALPVDIIAEHGAMKKEKGNWEKTESMDDAWKHSVLPLFNQITFTCPNAFVEEKNYSVAWHYRNADEETGYRHSRELIRLLQSAVDAFHLKVIDGNKIIEITTGQTNKGKAIRPLVEIDKYDCVICIGDDKTDEDMFECLMERENAITIKVGPGATLAKYKLDSVEEVISFLEQLK
jgi:trehalose 6-phosphate synthase/phosphatase